MVEGLRVEKELTHSHIHSFTHSPLLSLSPMIFKVQETRFSARRLWAWTSFFYRYAIPPGLGIMPVIGLYHSTNHFFPAHLTDSPKGNISQPTVAQSIREFIHPGYSFTNSSHHLIASELK